MADKKDEWYGALRGVLRAALSRYYATTYPDTDGEMEAGDFDELLQYERAKAWAEGFDAGEIDAFDADHEGHVCKTNPYKEA